jgi:hypothetical protein
VPAAPVSISNEADALILACIGDDLARRGLFFRLHRLPGLVRCEIGDSETGEILAVDHGDPQLKPERLIVSALDRARGENRITRSGAAMAPTAEECAEGAD